MSRADDPLLVALDAERRQIDRALHDFLDRRLPPVAVFAATGRLLFCNEAFRSLPEHGPDEPSAAIVGEVMEALAEACDRGGRTQRSRSVRLGDGQVRHYLVDYFVLSDADEVVVGVGAVYADATSQHLALQRLEHQHRRFDDIVRSSSDWIWEIDERGVLRYLSGHGLATHPPPIDLIGRPFFLFDPSVTVAGLDGLVEAIEARSPFRNRVIEVLDGESKPHRLTGVPVFDDETGDFRGFRGTATNIAAEVTSSRAAKASREALQATIEELRRKNADLDAALERAHAAAEAKSMFLANMSHELRTPLNAIIGYSEVLSGQMFGSDVARYAEYAQLIHRAGTHLMRLVGDVLDLAMLEERRVTVLREACDVDKLVDEALALVEQTVRAKRLNVVVERAAARVFVDADRGRAVQILTNLLGNASKFTPPDGRIAIGVSARENEVEVRVSDSGPGVPEPIRDRLFERFGTLGNAYVRTSSGSGLGLSISRHLAELMDGSLEADFAHPGGACFVLTLPRARDAAAA